jgi:hypothetical protein
LYFGKTNVAGPEHTVVMAKSMRNNNNNNNNNNRDKKGCMPES